MKKRVTSIKLKIINLIAVYVGLLVTLFLVNPKLEEFYDSLVYWEAGYGFFNGQIDLFRGYVFTGLLGLIFLWTKGKTIVWYLISLLFLSLYIVFMFSHIWDNSYEDRSIKEAFLSSAFVFFVLSLFFDGLFCYTLSDIWAFIVAASALVTLKKMRNEENGLKLFVFSFLTGALSYVAYNIRTIYLFFAIGLFIYFLICEVYTGLQFGSVWKKTLIKVIGLTLGIIVLAVPQFLLNYKYLGIYSIAVPTNNLFGAHLAGGLRLQRYDTYVGNQREWGSIFFGDQSGINILEQEGLSDTERISIVEYIKLALKYPLDFVGIYVRHFVNVLFPIWPGCFVKDLTKIYLLRGVGGFSLFFVFMCDVINGKIKNIRVQMEALLLMVPVLTILPGSAEVRFFMPFYLYMAGTLCYNSDVCGLFEEVKTNKWKYVTVYILTFLLVLAIWTSMLASYSFDGPLLFMGRN